MKAVSVTDLTRSATEIIERSKECGADKICYQRHGIQFFDTPLGYYKPEQIEQVLQRLRGYQRAAENLLNMASTKEQEELARKELSVLLQGLDCSGLLEAMERQPLSRTA